MQKKIFIPLVLFPAVVLGAPSGFTFHTHQLLTCLLLLLLLGMCLAVFVLKKNVKDLLNRRKKWNAGRKDERWADTVQSMDSSQIGRLLHYLHKKRTHPLPVIWGLVLLTMALSAYPGAELSAQTVTRATTSMTSETGILITIILLLLPVFGGLTILAVKLVHALQQAKHKEQSEEAAELAVYLRSLPAEEAALELAKRKAALDFRLTNAELAGHIVAVDERGLINIGQSEGLPIVATKKKAQKRPNVDPALAKLILWYVGCATFWLLFGTTIGEYIGVKFVAPDADHLSWLSFGRLRPVHTNVVFWGWASLGMLGLGYYVIPRVSNTRLADIRKGWYTLILINASVVAGTICLMAGINNGGGEYREYVWPVMALFAAGVVLTLANFLQTIARRTTKEIYISNWYIVSAIIFGLIIIIVAYVPYWQDGLGETIIQGYYMHQGVGMWFMLFTLGIVYYFLPQQLNKPIYSYSLGILAFWTQILFYTLIGTHHFVFSSIPWWLQTVAIVGSAGMVIPVIAGTTNFLMTFKGAWYKIKDSYTLPFFLVGIIFYFTGSMQGTAEAFRTTNLIWHFTDFTVAHSHLTMYGIICFFLWAGMYAIIPRLTGREAPQITIGAHFWLALIGLLFYTIPLMYGSTLKGLGWMEGKPFIDGVVLMAPYWLWRAVGGSLMWLSHIFFAYNLYRMLKGSDNTDIRDMALLELEGAGITPEPFI
jgi:cytochrome c oxidase cbb3-type subunit 1